MLSGTCSETPTIPTEMGFFDLFIVNVTRRGQTTFMHFIAEGDNNTVAEIIKENEDTLAEILKENEATEQMVNGRLCNGLTPLFFAVTFGRPEISQLLIDHSADASHVKPKPDLNALMMLAMGYDMNKDDAEHMDTAHYKECLKVLKEAGCDKG